MTANEELCNDCDDNSLLLVKTWVVSLVNAPPVIDYRPIVLRTAFYLAKLSSIRVLRPRSDSAFLTTSARFDDQVNHPLRKRKI